MSMLLDALRKSEKRQRARTLPDIHADAAAQPERQAAMARALWLALAATGLVALTAGAWYFWPQTGGPQLDAATHGAPAAATGAGNGADSDQGAAPAGRQPKPASPVATLAESTPGKTRAGQANLSKAELQERRKAERLARRKAERQAARQAARQAQRQAAPPAQAPATERKAAAEKDPDNADAGARPAAGTGRELEPISYWELPAAVRKQLPGMKISVLVFAEQADERFVLMDGQRLAEGDQLQDGLILQEVRRDGAVMRFNMYRFLVSHD